MVIEAGLEITVKAGGSFIKIDAGGVTVLGPVVKVNAGGTPGTGTENAALLPVTPLPVDVAKAGGLLERAVSQPAPDVIHKLSAVVSPLPGLPGYEDDPYTLFADGVVILEDLAGADGEIEFEHIPGTQVYVIELVNGRCFEIEPKEQSS